MGQQPLFYRHLLGCTSNCIESIRISIAVWNKWRRPTTFAERAQGFIIRLNIINQRHGLSIFRVGYILIFFIVADERTAMGSFQTIIVASPLCSFLWLSARCERSDFFFFWIQ